MGTNHVKVWANCLQTLEAYISSRAEADAATASAASHLKALTALGPCPKATWKKLVIDMQVPLKLASAFVNVADQDPDDLLYSTVFDLSSQALIVFLQSADVDGCASGEAANSRIEQAMRQQLEQSGLLQKLPEAITDTAADMTYVAQQAAAAAAAAAGTSDSSSSRVDYPADTATRAERLLLFVLVLLPWWPNGLHRQHMVASLAGAVCHMSLASVHLVSNLLIGVQQPEPDTALLMQGLLHRATKVSAEILGFRRGCAPLDLDYQALCDNPGLLGVIESQHFLPSIALNSTVLAIAVMVKERQGRQDRVGDTGASQASTGVQTPGAGAATGTTSGSSGVAGSSSKSGSSGDAAAGNSSSSSSRPPTQLEIRASRSRLNQVPETLPVAEYTAQAVSTFTEAERLLPKLTRSHRKLFSLLGVDPRVGVWTAVMLAQVSLPFQRGLMPVEEILSELVAVYGQTMDLLLKPGPHNPREKQRETWHQHLQLPQGQLQLERQLTLLVPFTVLHGALRLPTSRVVCLQRMVPAARVAAHASLWWETYADDLPRVSGDPWLQGQLPVQWLEDMLPALLKLGNKVAESYAASATAAASGVGGPGAASRSSSSSSSSSTAETLSERRQLLMRALEAAVTGLGPILKRCMKSAKETEGRGLGESARIGLLRACLGAAAGAFALVEAFVRAAAAGVPGGFSQHLLQVGVFRLLFCASEATIPASSLCCQADDAGKSVRALYSLLTSCLKLQSANSAPTARICASGEHAPFLVFRVAAVLLQDNQWPPLLLQAGGIPQEKQGSAAGDVFPTWYDPASRLPTVVLFGRCCLLWAQEMKTNLPDCLTQLAVPYRTSSSSSSSSSSSRTAPRALCSLQWPDFSAGWFFFQRVYKGIPDAPTWSHMQVMVDVMQNWITAHADVIAAAGCDAAALVQQLQQLLAARQVADGSTSTTAAAAVDEMVKELIATGKAYCAVPLKTLCNNPECGASDGPSELKLVGGGVGLCKGCLGVRYCSTACQKQHWKQHKPVCKALAARKAAVAAAAGAAAVCPDS